MDNIDLEKQVTAHGYKITTHEDFFLMGAEDRGYPWADVIARFGGDDKFPAGAWVVYDPQDDADGWLLIGDDRTELIKETYEHRIAS